MIANRSLPTDTLLPHIMVDNVEEAIAWYARAYGFSEHYRYGDPVSGAQMRAGYGWIMLKRTPKENALPRQVGYGTQSLTVFIEDVDGHYAHARAEGAKILEEPHETVYGEWQYATEDPDGHHWLFSRHHRNLSPDLWGAVVAQAAGIRPQIAPMLAVGDAQAAIAFYQAAFGARVLWQLGDEHMVAGLSLEGAPFFLASESPEFGTRGPGAAGFTTVRIELFVDNPEAVQAKALAAGASERSPVREHTHATVGLQPIRRMLQGGVVDPFGHLWLIGKFLE